MSTPQIKKLFPIHYLAAGIFLLLAAFAGCLYLVPNTMAPLITGLTLAYACDPVIDYFEKKGLRRSKAVFWFFILIGFLFLVFILFLIPTLILQLGEFIEKFPEFLRKTLDWLALKANMETSSLKLKLMTFVEEQYNPENFSKIANIVRVSFASTAHWFISLAAAMIIPVFFYFFLMDIDHIKSGTFKFIPLQYRTFARIRLMKIDSILSGFIRGQLMVAVILSLLYSLGLTLAGIKYSLLIGFASGILNIVPYLGVSIGLGASLLMAFFSENDIVRHIIAVLTVFGTVQVLEGFVITPRIVGKKVGLSPFYAILSLLVGGELFGISGMLAAIPVGGVMRVLLRDVKAAYFKSKIYQGIQSD